MLRRCFLVRLAALAAAPWLGACSPERPLAVGIHPWIGYETLYLAREFNWLPAGVQLREGHAASDSLAALQAGEVDAACLTLDEMLRARASGPPLTIGLVFDVSAGADVVMVRPSIRRLEDLAGKRLGVEQNVLGAMVLGKLLEAANLPLSAITLIDLTLDKQPAAWRDNAVDAVITYEPTASLLQREGAQRLYDSRRMPDTIFDVLAVRSDRADRHRAVLEAMLASHFRALAHLRTNRQDALYRIAAFQGIATEEVERALAGVTLPSLVANRGYLTAPDSRLAQAAKTLSTLMVQRGLLSREDALDHLLTAEWLPRDEE